MTPPHDSTTGARSFPTTQWSRLLSATGEGSAAKASLESLARRYARPIEAYARARLGGRAEEARDATQDFFVWMLEGDFLGRADPARGRFRAFVKTALAHFLHDRERARRTEKRGGAVRVVDVDDSDEPLAQSPSDGQPEAALDAAWRREVLAQATDALEAELEATGKALHFNIFRDYFMSEADLDYAAVAARYGVSTVDVSNYLAFTKKRYRSHLRAAVLETVQSDDDLRAELDWLFDEGNP